MIRSRISHGLRPSIVASELEEGAISNDPDSDADILVIAASGDPTARHFFTYAQQRGLHVAFAALEGGTWDETLWKRLVRRARGVYYREAAATSLLTANRVTAIRGLLRLHPKVIGLSTASTNWSKPLQMARIARSLGEGYVHAVNTVLESPLQALRGEDPLGIKWVVKSMSSRRSIVVFSDDSRLTPWEQCAGGPPVQRQRYIQGMNVRVHVVGKEVYACSVRSGEVDYRYASASVTFEEIVLPVGVEQWCVDAAASEGLLFAGIDMLEANGEFCCLEINPCPGYEDYEKRAFGGRYLISEAIISLLLDLPSGGSLPTAV